MIRTYLDGIPLPINPLDDITLQTKVGGKTLEIVELGDVTLIGSRGLTGVNITSMFTDKACPWSSVANPRPAESYVGMIEQMLGAKKPVRLIITGDGVDINMRCSINSFQKAHRAGEAGQVHYTLSLTEYREYGFTVLETVPGELRRPQVAARPTRSEEKPAGGTYTVKAGDCLWAIAKAKLGNGARYNEIYEANKTLIDQWNHRYGQTKYCIFPGQVLTIPTA